MMGILKYLKIFGLFLAWYYGDAPKSILLIWRNFILFVANYFSIPLLFSTLFSPWKRISEPYGRGFDIGRFFSVLTLNLFSRIIGFIIRVTVIFMGILAEVFVLISGFLFLIFWFFLPLILIWAFWRGATLL